MNPSIAIHELKNRLEQGIKSNYLSSKVDIIFFDHDLDIMAIELKPGENKEDFYNQLVKFKILQKDDQITITSSKV